MCLCGLCSSVSDPLSHTRQAEGNIKTSAAVGFFSLVNFEILGYLSSIMSYFRLVVKKIPKYTFRFLFYYTLFVSVHFSLYKIPVELLI